MGGEKDGGRERWAQTSASGDRPLSIDSQERGSSSKKSINSQAGGEEEDEQPSRGRPPAWEVREGGTVQREGALQPPPSLGGTPSPGGHSAMCALGDGCGGRRRRRARQGRVSCQCPACRGLCSQRYSCRKCSSVIS